MTNETDREPRAVTIALPKGGTGKTAIAINLADALSERGKTLLVDADPAGNATEGVGLREEFDSDPHLGKLLAEEDDVEPSDVITERGPFDVIPSHRELSTYANIVDNQNRFAVLVIKEQLIDPLLGDEYDYIVIDTAGDNDSLLREAAIYGTGNVIGTMNPGEEQVRGLETMLDDEITPAREHRDINILALVPTMALSDNESKRIIDRLNDTFPEYTPQFASDELWDDETAIDPGIRKRIEFTRAWRAGETLREYDPENDMLERLDELAEIVVRGGTDG